MLSDHYHHIIWDWNGTLLNDIWLCVDIANGILGEMQQDQIDIISYKEAFGFPITDYYTKIGVNLEKHSFEELTVNFMSNYLSNVRRCQLHDEAMNTLNTIKNAGKNQYILTAAHGDSVNELLQHYAIENYFDYVAGLDNHRAESKLDKGIHLMENNDIDKGNAVIIGDTIHDYEVAQELGLDCILIANGHQSKNRLKEKVGDEILVLDNLSNLVFK